MDQRVCDDALKATPGDIIHFREQGEDKKSEVVRTMWVESSKKGRIYSYEVSNGSIVPNTSVSLVEFRFKEQTKSDEVVPVQAICEKGRPSVACLRAEGPPHSLSEKQTLAAQVAKSGLGSVYKVAIACILDDTAESLRVAADLLRLRARQLEELEFAQLGVKPPTTNPKED